MFELEKWFKHERQYRHEVRHSSLCLQLKLRLECERDRQLVYEQKGDPRFRDFVLEKVREKFSWFCIERQSLNQHKWISEIVRPGIGATARVAQRLHQGRNGRAVDRTRAMLSWQTSDWFIRLVNRGTEEELSEYVMDTAAQVDEHRHDRRDRVVAQASR